MLLLVDHLVGNRKALHLLQLPAAAWSTTTLAAKVPTSPRTASSPLALRLDNRLAVHSKKARLEPPCLEQTASRHDASSVLYLPTTADSKARANVRDHIIDRLLQLPGKCMCRQDCGISVLAEGDVASLLSLPPYKGKRDRCHHQKPCQRDEECNDADETGCK